MKDMFSKIRPRRVSNVIHAQIKLNNTVRMANVALKYNCHISSDLIWA